MGNGKNGRRFLQARRLGQIHPEPVSPTLIAPGHLGRSVPKLLLDMGLVDLGRRGKAGEFLFPFAFGEIAPHPSGERCPLDQSRDLSVVEALRPHALTLAGHPAEKCFQSAP